MNTMNEEEITHHHLPQQQQPDSPGGGPTELELGEGSGGGSGGGGGGGGSRVRGPWSPEEDAVLSRLVAKFGARNWSLIARGIPGRSGKSCRLRWCNQLDPCLKRKPFTDEEDRIIISAHEIHGNKWASIARLLPGRTDNAIKNHWNSTLRRRCVELGKYKPTPEAMEDDSLDRTKASSDETPVGDINTFKTPEARDVTLSVRDINSFKPPEARNVTLSVRDINSFKPSEARNVTLLVRDINSFKPPEARDVSLSVGDTNSFKPPEARNVSISVRDTNSFKPPEARDVMMDNRPNQHEETAQTKEVHFAAEPEKGHPTLSRPVARVSAFNVFNPPNGPTVSSGFPRHIPTEGPLVQASKPDFGICKFLEDVHGEPMIPLRCGHGCCATPRGGHSQSSLLGPEFVEYEEQPPFSNQQLISIATDLNNIAWIKSGLENSSAEMPANATNQRLSQGVAAGSQMGVPEPNVKNDNMRFEDGRMKLMGMMNEYTSTQMPRPTFGMRAEVEGLS